MSSRFTLSAQDVSKWMDNQLEFVKPMALFTVGLYLAPIVTALQQPGHVTTFNDFIPSPMVVTSLTLYLVNAFWDIVRKWSNGPELK